MQSVVIAILSLLLISCTTVSTQKPRQPRYSLDGTGACTDGSTRQGYQTPVVHGIEACMTATQTCVGGKWQGPQLHETCDNHTKTCNGSPHGSVEQGYQEPVAAPGFDCVPATKTCLDGQWVGPEVFPHCTEQ